MSEVVRIVKMFYFNKLEATGQRNLGQPSKSLSS